MDGHGAEKLHVSVHGTALAMLMFNFANSDGDSVCHHFRVTFMCRDRSRLLGDALAKPCLAVPHGREAS